MKRNIAQPATLLKSRGGESALLRKDQVAALFGRSERWVETNGSLSYILGPRGRNGKFTRLYSAYAVAGALRAEPRNRSSLKTLQSDLCRCVKRLRAITAKH